MAISLNAEPTLDTKGFEWVDVGTINPETKEAEASLLVHSAFNPEFKAVEGYIDRHMTTLQANAGVGTDSFNLPENAQQLLERVDYLRRKNTAEHLVSDWKGVDAPYSVENCIKLFDLRPDIYNQVREAGYRIGLRIKAQREETKGK